MASYALSLYKASSLDMVPYQESSFVREQAEALVEKPISFLPPPSQEASLAPSLKSTARSRAPRVGAKKTRPAAGSLGLKKAPAKGGLSKLAAVMPPSSSSKLSSSPLTDQSYTIRGVRQPDGGYAKGLFRKGETPSCIHPAAVESTGAKRVRIRKVIRGQPKGFFSDSEDEEPRKGPSVASLQASLRSSHDSILRAHSRIAEAHLKIKELRDELDEMRRGYGEQLRRLARAAGVEHVL